MRAFHCCTPLSATFGVFLFVVLVCSTVGFAAPPVTPNAIAQPANQNSVLIPINYNAAAGLVAPNVIYDTTFSQWAQTTLTTTNKQGALVPAVGGATFLFQQCFGGGFLDDLNNTLSPNGVSWVGGSAAQFDQPAYGQRVGVPEAGAGADSPVGTPPINYWTNQLANTLVPAAPTSTTISNAIAFDPVGTVLNPPPKVSETGQLFYANGGQNIAMDNNANISHYAILFAGYTDAQRHYSSMQQIYNQLVADWAGTTYQITVLYGNGINQVPFNNAEKNPALINFAAGNTAILNATSANLQQAFAIDQASIQADYNAGKTNDQFFFYAGDHGGNTKVAGGGVGGGGPVGTVMTTLPTFTMTKDDLSAIAEDPIDIPTLTFDYTTTDSSSDVEVLLNGNNIGDLDSSTTGANSVTFEIPDSDFDGGTNSLALETLGGPALTVNDYTVFTGAVDDGAISVPEPTAFAILVGLACAFLLRLRWRSATLLN